MLEILPNTRAIPAGPVEIVGLAANTRELGLAEVPFEDIYLPFAQNPQRTASLLVKVEGPVPGIVAALRAGLQKLDPDGALYNARTFDEIVAREFLGERFRMTLVSIFAALAASLAAVGIYGAIAFSAAQRTREFALRIALGAMPAAIRHLMLARSARLVSLGAGAGLGIALLLGELLKSELYMVPHQHTGLLYGIGIHDPLTLLSAAAVVLALALFANLAPAARAARVEPANELRHD